jgi:hydroxyethylthiazole kinase
MIISPPFLPPRPAAPSVPPDPQAPADPDDDVHDAAYVAMAMNGGVPGQGAYPVSYQMNWHGGIHLTAPMDENGAPHKVRAIADGVVVFRRNPTPYDANPKHPLNYLGWTDNACVVIRHDTEIGANASGTPIAVTFFSIYMHLRAIPDAIAVNTPVYRKAEVGTAGQVFGKANIIHFEIVCDTDNVKRLTGRSNTYLSIAQDGRTDAVFGTMWFFLPADTPFFAHDPHTTPGQTPVYTSEKALWIGMGFQVGASVMETRDLLGRRVGNPIREDAYEYDLLKKASSLYPQRPSAGLELLRFGRVIGPEPLVPAHAPHWRHVAYEGGTGWVDLNGPTVKKFSDADFPNFWERGWMLVDASSTPDSRCTDPKILELLDADGNLNVSPSEWNSALNKPDVQEGLSQKICCFPSEWDSTTIDKRYRWLTQPQVSPDGKKLLPPSLDARKYALFKANVAALCFWQANQIGLPSTHWHFHPRAFITHFRKCGWLSARELAQMMMPHRFAAVKPDGLALSWSHPPTPNVMFSGALERAQTHGMWINIALRKYNLLNATRQIHLFSQLFAETGFVLMREGNRGHGHHYDVFYGRGHVQLTWPALYAPYGNFRALPHVPPDYTYQDPRITQTSLHMWHDVRGHDPPDMRQWFPRYDPELLADDGFSRTDSAGFYWSMKPFLGGATDKGLTCQAVGDVCILVNGGFNGFADRQRFAAFLKRYRGDSSESSTKESVTFAFRNTFVPPHAISTHSFDVDYTPQRP